MARLNEPPTESIESLKRRFVRQNRELARNNSTQSVKIRSLETQISQLAAENVTLRATIIQLQSELDERKSHDYAGSVEAVKKNLEAKLAEFQALVADLDFSKHRRKTSRRASLPKSPRQSPAQKLWKERCSIGEVLSGREGWLPTIAEGKHYPRRTLEPVEVRDLLGDHSSESPDIGPPPRCAVDQDDSPNFLSQPESQEPQNPPDKSAVSGFLSVNMDTRRKRRETNVHRDTAGVSSNPDVSPSKNADSAAVRTSDLLTAQPIRAGSKRKLDAANHPRGNENAITKAKDDIVFEKPMNGSGDQFASPTRRVLAPKSVNLDVSPKKQQQQTREASIENSTVKKNVQHSPKKLSSQRADLSDVLLNVQTSPVPVKVEPKTPAPPDLFSPGSIDHSEPRQEGRGDTPPPADLLSRSSTGNGDLAPSRVSRRARSGVSYAEPNLISKMRRPTKDLVDAVTQDRSRSVSLPATEAGQEDSKDADSQPTIKTVLVKRERQNDTGHDYEKDSNTAAAEPQSPLLNKDNIKAHSKTDKSVSTDPSEPLPTKVLSSESPEKKIVNGRSERRVSAAQRKNLKSMHEDSAPKLNDQPTFGAKNDSDIYNVGSSPPRRLFPVSKVKPDSRERENGMSSATSTGLSSSTKDTRVRSRELEARSISNTSTSSSLMPAAPGGLNRPRNRRQTLEAGARNAASEERPTRVVATGRKASADNVKSSRSSAFRADTRVDAEGAEANVSARRRSMML